MEKPSDQPYLVLAYYHIVALADPHREVKAHKIFCEGRDITARIYISEQGINGQLSASKADAEAYIQWMQSHPSFYNMPFKLTPYHENVFPRLTIKYRKQLVALDKKVDFSIRGAHVSPQQWKEMLEDPNNPYLLLDVRNEYEWDVGRFEGAELPPCDTFREFTEYAEKLKAKADPKSTPIMMYCTGGIRCELYSSLLKEHGFEKIYQLEGGVINYGIKEGSKHWKGKLFVFDDRLTVPISDEKTEVIGKCLHCNILNEDYYNCANTDCNRLFLCCKNCLHESIGCCQEACKTSPRLRPYQHQQPHKPFKRMRKEPEVRSRKSEEESR